MKPIFRITADSVDITDRINKRLLSLRTTDKPGTDSDDFELRIDDRDGLVMLPRRGAKLTVELGYEGQGLTRLGTYTADEIDFSGPPDTVVIRSKSGDTRGPAKETRTGSWEGVPLSQLVSEVAQRNGWKPECPVQILVERADQLNESDLTFINRLAKANDCTAKVADGKLIVQPRESGTSASGKRLGTVVIRRRDVSRFQFRLGDDTVKKAARAAYADKDGNLKTVEIANDDADPAGQPPVHTDRHIHANQSAAEAAAKARLAGFNRSTADVRLEMEGRTDIVAECEIDARGFKADIDGTYLVDTVEQNFNAGGWTTTVECNAGKKGKANAGKTLKVVVPD